MLVRFVGHKTGKEFTYLEVPEPLPPRWFVAISNKEPKVLLDETDLKPAFRKAEFILGTWQTEYLDKNAGHQKQHEPCYLFNGWNE